MTVHRLFRLFVLVTLLPLLCYASEFCLQRSSEPFVFIGLGWALYFCLLSVWTRTWVRLISGNLAAILLIFTVAEGFLAYPFSLSFNPDDSDSQASPTGSGSRQSGSYTFPFTYFMENYLLGYKPRDGITATSKKTVEGQVIYDVVYTIDPQGFRISPGQAAQGAPSILFFGDSLTFGEGLNDSETFPFRVEADSNGKYKSCNFAFHGYGPHQMLAFLQNGLERKIIAHHPPVLAVYLTIADHINRAAGRAAWDPMGPRYRLNDGTLQRIPWSSWKFLQVKIRRRMSRSNLWNRFIRVKRLAIPPNPVDKVRDLDLYIAEIAESQRILKDRYHCPLVVLFWWEGPDAENVQARLRGLGVRLIPIETIFPDFKTHSSNYLIPQDDHFNPLAASRIAAYLLKEMPTLLL